MTIEIQKKELLISLQDYMNKFVPGVSEIVIWLQQGDEKKALEGMVNVVEGLSWIMEALPLTQEFFSEPINAEEINGLLIQLVEGLEESDTILMADILEYEIIPLIENWNTIISGHHH